MPDPVDPEMPVAVPGAGSNIEDHEGMDAKVAHIVSEIAKDPSLDKATKRKRILTALDLQDDGGGDAGAGAEMPPPEAGADEPEPGPEPEGGDEEMKPEMEDEGDEKREKDEEEKEKKEVDKDEKETEEAIKQLKASTDPKHKELAEQLTQKLADNRKTRKERDEIKAVNKYNARKAKASKLCHESALPKVCITNLLIEQMAVRTTKGMKALLEDRLAIVNVKSPSSQQSYLGRNLPEDVKGAKGPDLKSFVESVNGSK